MTLRIIEGGYVQAPRYAWDPESMGNGSPAAITLTQHQFGGDEAAAPPRPVWMVTTWQGINGFGESVDGGIYPSKAAALRDIETLLTTPDGRFPYGDGSR